MYEILSRILYGIIASVILFGLYLLEKLIKDFGENSTPKSWTKNMPEILVWILHFFVGNVVIIAILFSVIGIFYLFGGLFL